MARFFVRLLGITFPMSHSSHLFMPAKGENVSIDGDAFTA